MHKIVIAMGSDDLSVELQSRLNSEFSVIRCFDGNTAEELLSALHPDILLIDLALPLKDGAAVLKSVGTHLPSLIIATTTYDGEYLRKIVEQVPIHKIFKLPCDVRPIIDCIKQMSENIHPANTKNAIAADDVADLLTELCVQSNWIGFQQLTKAITIYADDPSISMCKELYPQLTATSDIKSGKTAEHTMRSAIRRAWNSRDEAVWNRYFPRHQVSYPTNKVFIARLAQELKKR